MAFPFFKTKNEITDEHKFYAAVAVGIVACATLIYIAPVVAIFSILLAALAAVAHDLLNPKEPILGDLVNKFS